MGYREIFQKQRFQCVKSEDGNNLDSIEVCRCFKGEAKISVTITQSEKTKIIDKARLVIILCLGDKILREVMSEKTPTKMWTKLESLYMTKSLAHWLCMKQKLYSLKMVESKSNVEQLMKLNIKDLQNIEWNLMMRVKSYSFWVRCLDLLSILRMHSFKERNLLLRWSRSNHPLGPKS